MYANVCLQVAADHLQSEGRVGSGRYIILVSDGYQTSGGDESVIKSVTDPFKAGGGMILSLAAGGDETGEQKIREIVMKDIASIPRDAAELPSFYRAFETVADLEPVINSFLDTICEEVRVLLMMASCPIRAPGIAAHAVLIRSSAARSR